MQGEKLELAERDWWISRERGGVARNIYRDLNKKANSLYRM